MKKLIVIIAILAMATAANAWTIAWNPDTAREGVMLYWKATTDPGYVSLDIGNVDAYDLAPLPLVPGTRYEFYVDAYAGEPRSFSGPSDLIRWTFPRPPITIEMMGQPTQIIINP